MRYDVVIITAGAAGNVLAPHFSFASIVESAAGHHGGRTHRRPDQAGKLKCVK
jgi:hypothetical protein